MLPVLSELKRSGPLFYLIAGAALLCFMTAFALFLLYHDDVAADLDRSVDCRIDDGPCRKTIEGTDLTVTFDVSPKPVRPMKDLLFRIDLRGGDAPVTNGKVVLTLSMPGMYMAHNDVMLEHRGEGIYEGGGVIVKCPSGLKLWKAEISLETPSYNGGRRLGTEYTFSAD